MFRVFLLENLHGRFYIGHTDDLETRLHSHNRTDKLRSKITLKNGPWHSVWSEEHTTRASAMARERQIKSMKSARWIRVQLLKDRVPMIGVDRQVAGSPDPSGWGHFNTPVEVGI